MILLGVLLLVLGLVFGITVLTILGIVLLVIGAFFWVHPADFQGGRRWY